jgi:ligand-binding sensor domain-containing protein
VCYMRRILTRPAELPVLRFTVLFLSVVASIYLRTTGASAQRFTFEHHEQDEGLENHDVFKRMQDKTGFLWTATENGLFRYDGGSFHRFGAADGIQESMVIDVYQDASRRIWGGEQRPPLLPGRRAVSSTPNHSRRSPIRSRPAPHLYRLQEHLVSEPKYLDACPV